MRHLYMICYDISSDRKRQTKILKLMRGFGDHLQFSVFICELSAKEKKQLESRIETIIKKSEDQVLVIDLGAVSELNRNRVRSIGIPYKCMERHCVVF